jgi:hypothetical protein
VLSSHLRLSLPSDLFVPGFRTDTPTVVNAKFDSPT